MGVLLNGIDDDGVDTIEVNSAETGNISIMLFTKPGQERTKSNGNKIKAFIKNINYATSYHIIVSCQ